MAIYRELWDQLLPWVALGYNCSMQMSTRISPHELLFARRPYVPSAILGRLHEPLPIPSIYDNATHAAVVHDLLQRAKWVRDQMPVVSHNLAVAQHQDTARYARTRSGGYLPRLRRFQKGDFVYIQKPGIQALGAPNLQSRARDLILRVRTVRATGVLILEGTDGQTTEARVEECAPCHLPTIDPTVDHTQAHVTQDYPCRICKSAEQEETMVLCDGCREGVHIHCLVPPLNKLPEEELW